MYGLRETVVVCMDKIYPSTMQKRESRQGTEWGSRSETTGKALAIVVRRLGLCGEGVGYRLMSGVASAPSATTFLLPFSSLCSILPALLVELSSLFSPSPSFSSSSSSPSDTVLSCEQAQIDFSLCPGGDLPTPQFFAPLSLPLTNSPLTTPTH